MLSNALRSCTASRAGLATQVGLVRPFSALRKSIVAMNGNGDNLLLEADKFITSIKEKHPLVIAAELAKKNKVRPGPPKPLEGPQPALSIVKHPQQLTPGKFAAPPSTVNNMFAVIDVKGIQYKVTVGDTIVSNSIFDADIGETVEMKNVLMLGSRVTTVLGRPQIAGAKVTLEVEEKTKDKKVIAFKFRRRKNSRRTRGFRRQITILRVKSIDAGADLAADFA